MGAQARAAKHSVTIASPEGQIQQRLQSLIELLPKLRADAENQLLLDLDIGGYRYVVMGQLLQASRRHSDLSPREQEIARMVAGGYPNKIIAGVLDISAWTVCTYMRRIFAKLDVTSRAAMVARLHKDGILR